MWGAFASLLGLTVTGFSFLIQVFDDQDSTLEPSPTSSYHSTEGPNSPIVNNVKGDVSVQYGPQYDEDNE